MNYRHIFHAGNFADVFKHWILTLLLEKLIEKPTPFCVIDTHAGLGIYDLQHQNALKTLEQDSGVKRLLSKNLSLAFQAYNNVLRNNNDPAKTYPGSPRIIQEFLRDNDRLFAAELHEEDYLILRDNFKTDKRVKVLHQNGYDAIKALLPPKENRGLIFIDPPFEQTDEFAQITAALNEGLNRFAHGIYAIWYPVKDLHQVLKFYKQLIDLPLKNCLSVELHANEPILNQLNSCGMVIINAPWMLEQKLDQNLQLLLTYLDFTEGSYKLKWLKNSE
jgi:23S rRNA (adenine2030-N6)-methyltransferase